MRTALTINLNDDNATDKELISRVKQLAIEQGKTRSAVLQALVLQALDMPQAPDVGAEVLTRLTLLENMIHSLTSGGAVPLSLLDDGEADNIVARMWAKINKSKPNALTADDFKKLTEATVNE